MVKSGVREVASRSQESLLTKVDYKMEIYLRRLGRKLNNKEGGGASAVELDGE